MKYLDSLPITEKEKELIRALETDEPATLYMLIRLSVEAFEEYFGKERTWHLIRYLYPLLSAEDKEFLPIDVSDEDRFELFRAKEQIKKLMNK
jgi:uncharacterized protein with ParB-like and HNH nuclease domain